MDNAVKVMVGTVLGAGIGAGVSKLLERETRGVESDAVGLADTPRGESLKERWERARLAGLEARAAKEAEMRAYFREKVNDPEAMQTNPMP